MFFDIKYGKYVIIVNRKFVLHSLRPFAVFSSESFVTMHQFFQFVEVYYSRWRVLPREKDKASRFKVLKFPFSTVEGSFLENGALQFGVVSQRRLAIESEHHKFQRMAKAGKAPCVEERINGRIANDGKKCRVPQPVDSLARTFCT